MSNESIEAVSSTEINGQQEHQLKESTRGPRKNKKKRVKTHKKPKVFVTYTDEELKSVITDDDILYSSKSCKICDIQEHGVFANLNDDENCKVFIAKEELNDIASIKLGDVITVYIEENLSDNKDYKYAASEQKAYDLALLEKAQQAKEDNAQIKGYLVDEIKGGYSLAIFASSKEEVDKGYGLRAFLPFGQSSLKRGEGLHKDEIGNDESILVTISDLERSRGNIVVSRKSILASNKSHEKEEFFTNHNVGDVVEGKVSAVLPYGVFVNLGAVDGFLHSTDVVWGKRTNVSSHFKVNDEISAKIIELDNENQKVKLSIKDLNADPWHDIDKYFRPGMEVVGTVVAFAEFGVFINIGHGIEGLVHMGEMSWKRIKHPSNHFKLGQEVKALVLRVDKANKKISLSTKSLEESPVEKLSSQFPVGTVLKTKIESIHDFGIFVLLGQDVKGLVPKSEIAWIKDETPLDKKYKEGDEIEVAVLGYDTTRQRTTCSIKRLTDDPWPAWKEKFSKNSVHKVTVKEMTRAGALCVLQEGLEVFCPAKYLAKQEGKDADQAKQRVKAGDTIEVQITFIDPIRQKITISQKGAVESETKKAYAQYLSEQNKTSQSNATLGEAFKKFNKQNK